MDSPTAEQRSLLERVLRSHVFSDQDREQGRAILASGDRVAVSAHLDWVLAEVKDRKRRERELRQ